MKIGWPVPKIWVLYYLALAIAAAALSILISLPWYWLILLAGPIFIGALKYPRRICYSMLAVFGTAAASVAVMESGMPGIPEANTIGAILCLIASSGIVIEFMIRIAESVGESDNRLRSHYAYLAALHETSLGLINHLDVETILADIVARAAALIGTPHGYLFTVNRGADSGTEYLEGRFGVGVFEDYVGCRLKKGEGLSGKIWQTGQSMKIDDYSGWKYRAESFRDAPFRAVAAVPLRAGKEITGVIGVGRMESGSVFTDTELDVLERFAALASIAVENASLHHVVIEDLEERKKLQDALLRQATTDYLTGISNRAHFMERLETEIQRSARYRRPFSVLLLDIDKLKAVNDSHGHAAGDEAIRTFVGAIHASGIRQSDFFGRLGGDEFAIALPETTEQQALVVVARIRDTLAETPVVFKQKKFSIGASIGVAGFREGDSQESLLQRADEAMYLMKRS